MYVEDTMFFNSIRMCSYKCSCGKTVVISKQDRALCSECGHWVYKNKTLEFKCKLKEKQFKEKRKKNENI